MKLLKSIMMIMLVSCAALPSDLCAVMKKFRFLCGKKKQGNSEAVEARDSMDSTATAGVTQALAAMGLGHHVRVEETSPVCGGAGGEVNDVSTAAVGAGVVGCSRIDKMRQKNPSTLPIPDSCLSKTVSFLDKKSRAAFSEVSSEMCREHNSTIRALRFRSETEPKIIASKINRCPRLKKLSLWHCPGSAGFIEGLEEGAGEQLEELDLYWTGATEGQVREIVERCPRLKKLNLMYCLGAAGFIKGLAAGAGKQLEELVLDQDFSEPLKSFDQINKLLV